MCLSQRGRYCVVSFTAMYYCYVVLVVCCGDVIELVRLLFTTLTVAMRFEPANARFFVTEVLSHLSLSLSPVQVLTMPSCHVQGPVLYF